MATKVAFRVLLDNISVGNRALVEFGLNVVKWVWFEKRIQDQWKDEEAELGRNELVEVAASPFCVSA
jgi:hypothetical protein